MNFKLKSVSITTLNEIGWVNYTNSFKFAMWKEKSFEENYLHHQDQNLINWGTYSVIALLWMQNIVHNNFYHHKANFHVILSTNHDFILYSNNDIDLTRWSVFSHVPWLWTFLTSENILRKRFSDCKITINQQCAEDIIKQNKPVCTG